MIIIIKLLKDFFGRKGLICFFKINIMFYKWDNNRFKK